MPKSCFLSTFSEKSTGAKVPFSKIYRCQAPVAPVLTPALINTKPIVMMKPPKPEAGKIGQLQKNFEV